jgi:hypothetical protein
MRLRGDGASTGLRSRLRVAALWLIAILVALDVAGAAHLRELWSERHAELRDAVRPRAARLNASDSQRASSGSRIPSTR